MLSRYTSAPCANFPAFLPRHQQAWLHVRCRAGVPEQEAAAAASIRELLTRRSYAPPRYVGPVQVSRIHGKRLGLTAARNLSVGELLLVLPPLTAAFGAAGDAPGNDVLTQQLQGARLEPWQLQWLRVLDRQPAPAAAGGAPGSEAAASGHIQQQQQQQQLEDADEELLALVQQLLHQGPDAAAAASSLLPLGHTVAELAGDPGGDSAAAAAAAGSDQLLSPAVSITSVTCPYSPDQLLSIISGNAYSEAAEDLGASLLRELDPEAVTGLWPEYALLNHSCLPNTLALCVGRYLLVHVTSSVLQGEELTCSYLGERCLSPVAVRRAVLQGVYGFHCTCERCLAEQRTFPTQYYPADDPLLGLNSTSSSSSSGEGRGMAARLAAAVQQVLPWLPQQQQQQQGAPVDGSIAQPVPSAQHRLLLQQYEAVAQELRPALQAAATADSRRQEQQLQLLQQVSEAVEAVLQEVSAAVAADPWIAAQGREAAAAKWVFAAAYPLLRLQLDLIELLLSSGELPVDEAQVLLDSTTPGSTSSSNGSSSRAMAAAAAAAAARLSPNDSRRSRRRRRLRGQGGLAGWLSGLWGSVAAEEQPGGPVTKRQLLGAYAQGLGRAVGVLDTVARGSEAHVVACIQYMDVVRQLVGPDAEEIALAESMCGRAHVARYGVLRGREGSTLLPALISARRRQLLGASLARKMSVMAWEGAASG